jgi:hypothetical protein
MYQNTFTQDIQIFIQYILSNLNSLITQFCTVTIAKLTSREIKREIIQPKWPPVFSFDSKGEIRKAYDKRVG